MTPAQRPVLDTATLWIAQGFGFGRIPFAPGTFGSLLGFGWYFFLLSFQNRLIYSLGSIFGVILSIWSAGRAEKILGRADPSSVVIDEIAAIPFCFVGSIFKREHFDHFLNPTHFERPLLVPLIIFAAFRLFDILKPWPINRSQKLSGGWGITADDLLAAAYVNLLWLLPISR